MNLRERAINAVKICEAEKIVAYLENTATGQVYKNIPLDKAREIVKSWADQGTLQRDIKVKGNFSKSVVIHQIIFKRPEEYHSSSTRPAFDLSRLQDLDLERWEKAIRKGRTNKPNPYKGSPFFD